MMTLGKPMGNGHPVGGVVTRTGILRTFRQEYRYFNPFGGNPVSCAAAMAVLEEFEEKNLVATPGSWETMLVGVSGI